MQSTISCSACHIQHTQGVAQDTASSFIAATYLGIARDAQTAVMESEAADGFDALIAEQGPNSNTTRNPHKKCRQQFLLMWKADMD